MIEIIQTVALSIIAVAMTVMVSVIYVCLLNKDASEEQIDKAPRKRFSLQRSKTQGSGTETVVQDDEWMVRQEYKARLRKLDPAHNEES